MGGNSCNSLAIFFHLPRQLVRARATHSAHSRDFCRDGRCPGKFRHSIDLVESHTKVEQRRRLLPHLRHPRQRWLSACLFGPWLERLVGVRHGSHASAFNDEQPSALSIRIRGQRSPHLFRRGKAAFEFQSFSLVLAKDFSKVEHARKYTRKRIIKSSFRVYLPSLSCAALGHFILLEVKKPSIELSGKGDCNYAICVMPHLIETGCRS